MAKDKEGRDLGEALDSRTTVAAAGLENGASLVIKTAGAAAAPGAASTLGQQGDVFFVPCSQRRALLEFVQQPGICLSWLRCFGSLTALLLHARCRCAAHALSDVRALAAAEHISQVVAAIRGGHVTRSASGHLLLPDGLRWPIATNNTLFVRRFYAPLLEKVLNMCLPCEPHEDTAVQRRIVTGQPGIGKSVWM